MPIKGEKYPVAATTINDFDFLWNEIDISTKEIIKRIGKPILGQRTKGIKTHWYVYMKEVQE